jgi:hypothetical protein
VTVDGDRERERGGGRRRRREFPMKDGIGARIRWVSAESSVDRSPFLRERNREWATGKEKERG